MALEVADRPENAAGDLPLKRAASKHSLFGWIANVGGLY